MASNNVSDLKKIHARVVTKKVRKILRTFFNVVKEKSLSLTGSRYFLFTLSRNKGAKSVE